MQTQNSKTIELLGNLKVRYDILFILGIIFFQHLTIVRVANYEFTALQLILPLGLFKFCKLRKKIETKSLLWFASFALYPLINFSTIYSVVEFLKTYLQFIICISIFLYVYNSNIKINKSTLAKAFVIAQIFLFVLILLQYFLVVQFNQDWFFNPFGSYFSYKYPMDRWNFGGGYNAYRMKGVFLEPSYAAFVAITIYVCRYILEQKFIIKSFLLTLITLFFVKSSFGFLVFPLISVVIFLKAMPKFYALTVILIIALVIAVFGENFNNLFIENTKLDKFEVEGYTSAYTRWIFPYNLTKSLFQSGYYLGYAMGQLDPVINRFDEIIIDSGEEGVSNSFFLIIIYFGLFSLLLAFYVINSLFFQKKLSKKIILIFVLICLTNTGAFNTIEFFFVAIILPFICYRVYNASYIYNNCNT